MSDPAVVVVVVAYGSAALLGQALHALGDLDVVVVDNSSDPNVLAAAAGARYLDAGSNLGFAGGVNLALGELARDSRDVLLLNPDAVVSAAQVAALHQALSADPRLAAVAPRLANEDGSPQRGTWPWPSPSGAWLEALGRARRDEAWLVGACLLLRREALEAVGGMDERYFLYQEETDWQRRAVDQGWALRLVEEVVVTHVGAATSTDPARRRGQFHAAAETYVRKWFGRRGWLGYRTAAALGSLARGVVLRGDAAAEARARAALYVRGPRRVALARGWIPSGGVRRG